MEDGYIFYSDSFKFEYKAKDKKYYVEGYISTKDKDLYDDIVTQECLDDMVEQLNQKNIKLDVDHEAWNKSSRLIPVGKIISAKKDEKGIYVQAEINKAKKEFKEVWNSIKDKFLDAFSIAYKVIKQSTKIIDETPVRLLEKVDLVNVALTGNPVNPNAKMMKVFMKSLKAEDNKMSEENTEQKGEGMDYKKKYEEMKAKYEEMEKEMKALKEKMQKKKENYDEEEGDEPGEQDTGPDEKKKKSCDTRKSANSESENLESKSVNDSILELKSSLQEKDKVITELKSKVEELENKPELKAIMDKLNESGKENNEQEKNPGMNYLF